MLIIALDEVSCFSPAIDLAVRSNAAAAVLGATAFTTPRALVQLHGVGSEVQYLGCYYDPGTMLPHHLPGDQFFVVPGEGGGGDGCFGDINDDGYGDLIVGAPDHDDTASNAGAAYVFLGQATPSGAMTGADATAEVAGELRERDRKPPRHVERDSERLNCSVAVGGDAAHEDAGGCPTATHHQVGSGSGRRAARAGVESLILSADEQPHPCSKWSTDRSPRRPSLQPSALSMSIELCAVPRALVSWC